MVSSSPRLRAWTAIALLTFPMAAFSSDSLPSWQKGQCIYDPNGELDDVSIAHIKEVCTWLDKAGDGQLAVALVPAEAIGKTPLLEFRDDLLRRWADSSGVSVRAARALLWGDDIILVMLTPGYHLQPGVNGSSTLEIGSIKVGKKFEAALPQDKLLALMQPAFPSMVQSHWGDATVLVVDALAAEAHDISEKARVSPPVKGLFLFVLMLAWVTALLVMPPAWAFTNKAIAWAGYPLVAGSGLAVLVYSRQFLKPLLTTWLLFAGMGALAYFIIERRRHRNNEMSGSNSVHRQDKCNPTSAGGSEMTFTPQRKDPTLAGILSAVLIGGGQVYCGKSALGFALFFGTLIAYMLRSYIFGNVIPGLALHAFAVYNAYRSAEEINGAVDRYERDQAAEERKRLKPEEFVEAVRKIHTLLSNEMLTDLEFRTKKEALIAQLSDRELAVSHEDFLGAMIGLKNQGILGPLDIEQMKKSLAGFPDGRSNEAKAS